MVKAIMRQKQTKQLKEIFNRLEKTNKAKKQQQNFIFMYKGRWINPTKGHHALINIAQHKIAQHSIAKHSIAQHGCDLATKNLSYSGGKWQTAMCQIERGRFSDEIDSLASHFTLRY